MRLLRLPIFLLLLVAGPAKAQSSAVTLSPGADIQSAVNANPANTTFVLVPGVYRLQSIQPKNGDSFLGQNNPVLSGARILTAFVRQGNLWVATGQTQQGVRNGLCDAQHPRCMYPEDLFFDNTPLLHVDSLASVAPGRWYFDYPNAQIYFADDPTGHLVETSVTRSAFSGLAANVSISGLTVEKYATPGQLGAIGDQSLGPNWIMRNNEIRWNHSGGINIVDGGQATANFIHHNGQKGIGGTGHNVLVQGNEVSSNNWAGFATGWEAGGMKFALTSFLTVQGNYVHDNAGPGIWSDVDCIYTLYESNVITNNGGSGIQHEISYAAIIRYNNICNNSMPGPTTWLWGSQILIQNSQNVEVYGNNVDTAATSSTIGSNGVGIIQQNRGTGLYGPRVAINNSVYNNTIVYRGASSSGEVADYNGEDLLANGHNSFDYNSYHLANPGGYNWVWVFSLTFVGLQQANQELHGSVDSSVPSSLCSAQTN